MLGNIATRLDIDPDDLKLAISMVKVPKNKARRADYANQMTLACSPMRDSPLGRSGQVLWRMGLVEHFGTDGAMLLLGLRGAIERSAEPLLADEILQTWEEYA